MWKNNATKMHFLFLAFLKLSKVEMFFQKQDLYTWMKGKNRPDNQLTQTGRVVTNFFWNEENHDSNWEILRKAIYMSICTKENSSHLAQVFVLFAGSSLLPTLSLISLFYYSQSRFYYRKVLGTPEEDRQVFGFVNPV